MAAPVDLIKKALFLQVEQFLTLGRKSNISVVTILHETTQFHLTRCIIYESRNYVLFPKASIRSSLQFLKNYMNFTDDELQQVRKMKTRTLYIHKMTPQYMISDDTIRLL